MPKISGRKEFGILAKTLEITIEILEVLLALGLILMVILSLSHLIDFIISVEIHEGLEKNYILEILDLTLLLILSVDILRTLAVAVRRRALPVRIVVEAAMVALLREIIAVEIRHLDWKMMLSLGVTFALLAGTWVVIGILQKRGEIEATAVEEA